MNRNKAFKSCQYHVCDAAIIGVVICLVHQVINLVVRGRRPFLFCTGFLACNLPVLPNPNDHITVWAITNEARTQPNPGAVLDSGYLESFVSHWEKVGINVSGNRSRALRDFDYAKALYGQQVLLSILADYRSSHVPHQEITIRFFTWDDYLEKLKQISDNESAPDVIQIPSTWCSSLAKEFNVLAPIQQSPAGVLEKFPISVKTACQPVGSGQIYGVPWLLDVRVLFFWRDSFPALDRELEESTDKRNTFELALEFAKQRSHIIPFGFPTARDWELLHQTALLVWGEHGELMRPRRELLLSSSYEPAFEGPALKGALYVRSLARRGLIDLPRQDRYYLETEFLDKRRGSIVSGPWLLKFLQQRLGSSFNNQIGVALPPFGDNMDVSFLGGSFLGLTKIAEKRRQSGAVDLVSYLTTGEVAAQYARSTGLIPADANVVMNRSGSASTAQSESLNYGAFLSSFTSDQKIVQTIGTAIERGRSYPAIPRWWRLEAPAELSALYLLWQDIAANQSDWDLDTDLRQLSQSWDKELRAYPWWATWAVGGTISLMGIGIGVWWFVRGSFQALKRSKREMESRHRDDADIIKDLEQKLAAFRSGATPEPPPLADVTITIKPKSLNGSANGVNSSLTGREFKIFAPLLRECLLRHSPVRFSAVWAIVRLWAAKGKPASPHEQLHSMVTEIRNFFRRLDPRLADRYISSEHGVYELTPDEHLHLMVETGDRQIPFIQAVCNPYTEAMTDMEQDRYEAAFEKLAQAFQIEERLDWPDAAVLIAILDCYTHLDTSIALQYKRVVEHARDKLQKVFEHHSHAITNYGPDIVGCTAVGPAASAMIIADWEAVLAFEKKLRSALEGTPLDILRLPPEVAALWEPLSHPKLRARLERQQIKELEKEIWEHFSITHGAAVFGPVRQTLERLGSPTERFKVTLGQKLSELNKINYELVLSGSAPGGFINPRMITIYDYLAEALQQKLLQDVRSTLLGGAPTHVLLELAAEGDGELAQKLGQQVCQCLEQGRFPESLESLVDTLISLKNDSQRRQHNRQRGDDPNVSAAAL